MYLSFIIDNLISLFIKNIQPLEDNPNYIKMLEVQTKISDEIDKLTKKNSNNKKYNHNKNFNINLKNIENEQNEYMLREKILTLSLKIYKEALISKGDKLKKLKKDFKSLIDLYKENFINPKKNQLFPINQNTLDQFDFLSKNNLLVNTNNSNLAAGLANLSFNSKKNRK